MSWDIFDGMLTHGKVVQAKALYEKSKTAVDEETRNIELEVRTAYSDFLEAQEVLESQKTVQEEAEESLREANARADAGTGTQLDVLDAENRSRRRAARRCRRCTITTPRAPDLNAPSARKSSRTQISKP